jgi:hypothetical protein
MALVVRETFHFLTKYCSIMPMRHTAPSKT